MRTLGRAIGPVTLSCLVASPATAHAQVPAGNEFIVNAYTTDDQLHSSLAMGPDGSFLVFWDSWGNDGSYSGVFGRRFDAAGTAVDGDFQVNQFTTLSQSGPAAAPGADGSFIVAWQSEPQDGDRFGIFGRRYDGNGAPIGGEFQVNTYTTDRQAGASIGSGSDGSFVVVWSSWNQDGDYWGVFGQRFDAVAERLGDEFQVSQFTFDYQSRPSVAVGPDGGFVVAWDSYAQDGSAYGVFARRYDAAGVPLGGEFPVNTYTTEFQCRPAVEFAPDGAFVVVWDSFGQDGDSYGVYARRFDAAGLPLGPERRVNSHTTSSQAVPALAFSADGHYVVTWQSWNQDGNQWGVFGRLFSPLDAPGSEEFQISQFTTGTQAWPSIASMPDGRFVVTWVSDGQDGSRFGVVARRYSAPDLIFGDGFEAGLSGQQAEARIPVQSKARLRHRRKAA